MNHLNRLGGFYYSNEVVSTGTLNLMVLNLAIFGKTRQIAKLKHPPNVPVIRIRYILTHSTLKFTTVLTAVPVESRHQSQLPQESHRERGHTTGHTRRGSPREGPSGRSTPHYQRPTPVVCVCVGSKHRAKWLTRLELCACVCVSAFLSQRVDDILSRDFNCVQSGNKG